ncbi:MAG: SBBP repeat-containing protein [Chloroflexi bacterium]|nr:SBBP repeat-containing protein [Chloroflexota bacterium]
MNPSQPSATTINVVFIPGVDCNSYACKLVLDTSGAAYVTGYITSATLPVTPGAFDTTFNGGAWSGDSFVVKLAASGAIIYATYLGGTNDDWGYAIAVDSSGAAYVTGSTGSSDFPTTAGAFHTVCGNGLTCGQEDAFVTKFDPTGSSLVYSTFLGGDGFEWGSKIAVDSSGAVYIMGLTGSPDFPTTPGAYQTTMNGMSDLFVTKLNAAGSALVYSTYIGSAVVSGCNPELVSGGALDQSGAVYVVGSAPSTFPTTPGAFQTVHGGCSDGIVFKLSADGSALLYSTFLGGSDVDDVYGITIDLSGAIYVSGDSCSSDFPTTPGAYQTTQSNCDAVVAKLDPTLSTLLYSTYIGGSQLDGGLDIVTDASGAAYVSGSMIFVTTTVDFPITPDAVQPVPGGGNYDAFVLVLSPGGNGLNDLLYSTYLGGSGDEHGWSIALDASGGIHVAGGTTSSDFPHSARPTQIRATATVTPTGYVATFAAPTVAQDIANGVSYNGWHGVGDLHASGGAYRVSKVAKDSATFKFSGTSITWVTRKGPDQGKAQVTIDGVNKGTLDLYSPTVQWNVQQSFGGLTNASHTLVVKVAGTKNPGSTDFNVALDAFIVGSTTTQESALAVQYDSWTGVSDTRAFGGSYRTSKTASATASWTFSGTQVDWITALGPSYGQAKVFLDGVDQGTIDLYAATQQWKAVKAFTTGAGTHTIQVQVLGTKNPLSRGTQVLVDSFQSFP